MTTVLREISGACVDTKQRGTEATCIICGNGRRLRVSLRSQREQQKTLVVARKQGDSNFARTCLQT